LQQVCQKSEYQLKLIKLRECHYGVITVKMPFNSFLKILLTLGLICLCIEGQAFSGDDRPRRGPPPEAINACQGKVEGDACQFTGRFNENLEGKCHQGPFGRGELACRPKPPQEAFAACQDKNEGDACSFIGRMGEQKGSCRKGPRGESELACAPKERMMPENDENPDPAGMPEPTM
jgi:hypothetical protein